VTIVYSYSIPTYPNVGPIGVEGMYIGVSANTTNDEKKRALIIREITIKPHNVFDEG
jgi:hypothetical protein